MYHELNEGGVIEVFSLEECNPAECDPDDPDKDLPPGVYYWHCFPGCLPDSDPIGPFENEEEAISHANEN